MSDDCRPNGDAEPGVTADWHALAAERPSLGGAEALSPRRKKWPESLFDIARSESQAFTPSGWRRSSGESCRSK
jgi:hypothetical protein